MWPENKWRRGWVSCLGQTLRSGHIPDDFNTNWAPPVNLPYALHWSLSLCFVLLHLLIQCFLTFPQRSLLQPVQVMVSFCLDIYLVCVFVINVHPECWTSPICSCSLALHSLAMCTVWCHLDFGTVLFILIITLRVFVTECCLHTEVTLRCA